MCAAVQQGGAVSREAAKDHAVVEGRILSFQLAVVCVFSVVFA